MKHIIITILFLSNSILLNAQNNQQKINFSGTIMDAKTNKPLQGVSVFIVDTKTGTATDEHGNFFIKNLSQGKHLVEVSHVGFNTISEYVDIQQGNANKNFTLSESVIENNTVVVTGISGASLLKKVPFQIDVLKKRELLQSASSNIIETLTKKPGVSALSTGPAIAKPVIRGLGYNRVLTINDGIRQEGQQWGDEHGIEIDDASVSKVEILKGPASLIYGSDAMAGVLNIITNVPVANNTISANILSNYQTNNNLRSLNANVSGNTNSFNWNIYSSNKAAADYRNKYDGRVFNSKFKENNVGGYVGYNNSWGYSHLIVSNFDLKAGLVEGERDDEGFFLKLLPGGIETRATEDDFKSTTPFIPFQRIRHFKIATDNSIKIGKGRIAFNVGFQNNKREEFGNPEDLNERELFFDLKTVTYTTQYHLPEKNGWKNSVGINGMQQQNINKGVEQLIPDYRLFDVGGYIFSQKTINDVTLSGGIRFDNRNIDAENLLDGVDVKGEEFKKSFSNFSGSVGMAAALTNKVTLKLNIARGFRAPNISELASNGAHEGTARYEYGDANLKSETSLQTDAGLEFNTEHISLGLSAFYNSFNNFIFYRKLNAKGGGDSTINIDGEELTAFKFDQRKATLKGLEISLDFHPHPLDWLHIENTFSLVSGKLREAIEGTKFLPFMPAPKLQTEVRANFNAIKNTIRNFYIKFELDNTFAQKNIFSAFNTETATPGYALLNAGIGGDVVAKKGRTIFSLFVAASNIADVAYQNHLSRLKYAPENLVTGRTGVFNMGRNFSIKLNIPLVFKLKDK